MRNASSDRSSLSRGRLIVIRLSSDQLAYIINHAGDRAILVDGSQVPLLEAIKD